jgi:putative ABC transport system ATP-binding protein
MEHKTGMTAHSDSRHHEHLRHLIWLERRDLWTVFAFSVGAGLMALATPIAVQTLVNTIAFGMLIQPLVVLVLVLVGCLTVFNLLIALQIYVVEMLQRRVFVRLVGTITSRLQRVTLAAFDGHNGPELVNRFFDVMTVQKSGTALLLDGLAYGLQAVIGMLLLAFYHPVLLALDILLVVSIFGIFASLLRRGVETAIQESRTKYAVAAWLQELARNTTLFKWAGGLHHASAISDRMSNDYLRASAAHFSIAMRQQVGLLILHTIANTALLGLGGWMVIERQLTLGQLIAAELVVNAMMAGLSRLGKSLMSYYDLMAAMDKLGHLIDLPQERQNGAPLPPSSLPASVTLHKLTFTHGPDHRADQMVRGLCASAAAGQRIALCGSAGSGRDTLLEILMGLRMPASGTVLIDGFDIRDLQLGKLRQDMAVVRSMEIIEDSVLENIRVGRENIAIQTIRDTLEALGLADDIMALEDGLNTPLNYLGQPLPPEKLRRLLLARAVVGKPRLLLLHETLDALDPEVSEPVIDWVLRPEAPWTAIVVTRNPAVIARCDRLWQLENGHLTETPVTLSHPATQD